MVNVTSGFSRIEAHSCAGAQLGGGGGAGGGHPRPNFENRKKSALIL